MCVVEDVLELLYDVSVLVWSFCYMVVEVVMGDVGVVVDVAELEMGVGVVVIVGVWLRVIMVC